VLNTFYGLDSNGAQNTEKGQSREVSFVIGTLLDPIRPRQILNWMKTSKVFGRLVASID